MFEGLKKNLEQEKKIIVDMHLIQSNVDKNNPDYAFYNSSLNALAKQLMLLNDTVPGLLKEGLPVNKFSEENEQIEKPLTKSSTKKSNEVSSQTIKSSTEKPVKDDNHIPKPVVNKNIVNMSYFSPLTKEKRYIAINKKDRKEFLEKLRLSESALSGIKKIEQKNSDDVVYKPNSYAKFSNRFFRNYSEKLVPQFDKLSKDLEKANVSLLLSSYLSMAMMSMVIAFIFGVLIFVVLLVFNLSNWIYFVLPFGFAGLALAAFYLYPSSEAKSVQKKILQELPFATIHMSAIASSNIEPVKIFKIIASSEEYPNIGKEIKKILIQINVYGYDLVTSLKNISARTSNKELAELFSGMATNISTGGSLRNYLEKKSENFLVNYRLERQKYSALAGTFMDVYISILIAAPLVLMMMFIVMNVAGLGMGGIGITTLLIMSVLAIVVVNIIFLIVINMKQPKV